jgi:hypothetical protein
MTLSNQSQFLQFFSPRKMTYRNLANSGLQQAGIVCPQKMLLIWQDDFTAPPNSVRLLTGAWPIPAYDKPELARPR